jgi:hypothetical protein
MAHLNVNIFYFFFCSEVNLFTVIIKARLKDKWVLEIHSIIDFC